MTKSLDGYLKIRALLSKGLRPAVLLSATLLFLIIINLPTPSGLTPEGQKALAIFFVSIMLWVTHALPLMITSLLVVILFPLTGVLDSRESYALFGNEAIFFILGAFILASGIMRSGLSTRLAVKALRHFGHSPNFLILNFLFLSAFLSFFMSEHAVAAMMFPIVFEVVDALKLRPMQSRYGKALFLAMAWGCVIGGIATFLGGARAPLALGILNQTTGESIGFVDWALAALPTVLIMLVLAYFMLVKMFPSEIADVQQARIALKKKKQALGKISKRERTLGFLMLFTILCWIIFGEQLGLANIAIAAVVVAFVLKLLDWKEVEEDVNWGIFLMYGGAICLGFAMDMTGAAHWLADKSLGFFVESPFALVLSLCFISLFLTEAISNTAVVALMMPLAIGLAQDFHIDTKVITMILTIPSGLALQLPMGTPATAIAFSSGYVRLRDTIVGGMILKLLAFGIFVLSVYFYWPLLGFQLLGN